MFLRPTVITTIGDATFKNLSIFSGDDSALATGKKLIFESSYPDETNLTLGDSYIMYDGTNASLNFIENGNDSIILKSGNVGIGTTSPFAKLSVEGDVVADSFIGTSAATSTFGGGIDIATGCFAIAGTCIGTGGGGGSSLFTDAGSFTYLTATSNDVIFGGSDTSSAPFWWDVSEAAAYIQGSTPGDSVLQLGADDDAWTFGYSNSDKSFRIASSTALGSDDVFTILKGGNTGIGTTTPWKTLSVDGTFALSSSLSVATVGNYLCINQSTYEVTAGTTCSASSERFKEDINPLSYGLAQVMALNPVSFRYKPTVDPDNSKRLGFIAEEVFEIVPELVALDKEGLPESVDYAKLTPVLVQAIKDLNVRIDDLSALAALAQGTSTNVGGSSGEGGSSSSGLMGNVWSAVKGQMESFGVFFESAYTRITKLFVRELHIEEKLCIDDVCIDKDQLKALIVQAGATPTNTGGSAGDLNNDGDLNQGGDVNGAGDNDGNNDTEPNDGHDDEDGDGSNDDDEGNGANDDDETSQNGAGDDENDSNGSSGDGEDNDGLGNENNSDGASNGGSSDAGDTGDGGDAGNTGGETAGSSGEGNGGSGSEGSGSAGGEGTGGTE